MNKIAYLVVAAGLSVALLPSHFALAQNAPAQAEKKVVKTADDLPTYEYVIALKPSEFLEANDEVFGAFVQEVRTNLENDLTTLDIQDKTTLRDRHSLLAQVAMLQGRDEDVRNHLNIARENEQKEASKLMVGHVVESMIAGKAAAGEMNVADPAFTAMFEKTLANRWNDLPWDKVAEAVKQQKGRAELITKDLLMGQVKMGMDPVWEQAGQKLSGDIAHSLVSMRSVLKYQLAINPSIAKVAKTIIEKNATERIDTWTPTVATLTGSEGGKPVVIAVWDSGIDAPVFKNNLWTNEKESPNGTDDDANGFIDDMHGIAFDLEDNRIPELLHPVTEMQNDPALVKSHTKGLMDIQASVDSPERTALIAYMKGLDADKSGIFLEDLGLYGNVAHGTHVAGISLAGNPYARLLGARLTFDFKSIPRVTPSIEQAKKTAANYQASVDYMKAAGVRVVNMSWGGSKKDVETQLEQKGVGKDPADRDALARQIFDIMSNGLRDAMASAPDILFVAAAGNSDNNNAFAEFMPSGFSLPNMITVGAIDSTGKPTSFTTFGDNVTLYANGFEVDSFVPGGDRMKFSGTSMAAPQVTNLVGKMLALKPEMKIAEVIDFLKRGSDPLQGKEGRLVINQKKTIGMIVKPN